MSDLENPQKYVGYIYLIEFVDGMKYVGQTIGMFGTIPSLEIRLRKHEDLALTHSKLHIHRKLKEDSSYIISCLAKLPSDQIHILDDIERVFIKRLNTVYPNGLNCLENRPAMGKTKQKLIEYYGLEVFQSEETKERNTRVKQKTMKGSIKDKLEILKEMAPKCIQVKAISHGGVLSEIRLIFINGKQRNRMNFAQINGETLIDTCKRAIKFAKKVNKKIIEIPNQVKDILNGGNGEVYKYQDKIDQIIKSGNVSIIAGKLSFNKYVGKKTYTVRALSSGRWINQQFGGKYTTEEENLKAGRLFEKKLCKQLGYDLEEVRRY